MDRDGEQPHGRQAGVGVDEHLLDVGEFGDELAVQVAVGGVVDGLVEGVGADADGGPAQVELAHVDRIQGRIPGALPAGEDLVVGDGIAAAGRIRPRTSGS